MKKTLLTLAGLCGAACAQHPAPTEQIASSLAAVRGAEEVGGENVPQAALHMQLAREQIEKAKDLMKNDENQRAEDKALRAGADAELAVAIAHEERAKAELAQFSQANPSAGAEAPQTTPTQQGATP